MECLDRIEIIGGVKNETEEINPSSVKDDGVDIGIQDIIETGDESEGDIEKEVYKSIILGIEDIEENDFIKYIEEHKKDLKETDNITEKLILNDGFECSDYNSDDDGTHKGSDAAKNSDSNGENEPPTNNIIVPTVLPATKSIYHLGKKDKYSCEYCKVVTENHRELQLHILSVHKSVNLKQCPHCPFQTNVDLEGHILRLHKEFTETQYFRCHNCEYKGKSKAAIRNHIHSIHLGRVDAERIWKCDQCPKSFSRRFYLIRHKFIHKDEAYKCSLCEYVCYSEYAFNCHIERFHTNTDKLKTLKCQHCSYQTKHKYLFKRHNDVHARPAIQCHLCAFTTKHDAVFKLHLIGHKTVKEDKDLKYRCKKCDYKTHRWNNLKIHHLKHSKPEEIQYFHCYHCNFKANRKDNLKNHVMRHYKKEEVSLECYLCSYKTKNRQKLTCHIGQHSKGENMEENDQE